MRIKFGIMAACVALALTGCTSQPTGTQVDVIQQARGLPAQIKLPRGSTEYSPQIYWTGSNHQSITFVAYGSGSCPVVPETYQLQDGTHLTLNLKKYDGACTADLAPHTMEFKKPDGLNTASNIKVTIHDENPDVTDSNLTLKPAPSLADL